MRDEKTVKIIEAIRNMTHHEAGLLEVFLSGFQAGKRVSGQEMRNESAIFLKVPAPRGDGERKGRYC